MTEKVLVELSEKDIKDLVCEKLNLDKNKATILVSYSGGDRGEPEVLWVTVTSEKLKS